LGSLIALGAWAAVAHNSGSGWVQTLGALLAGFLFVGLVAPAFVVRRVKITALSSPLDAIAGNPAAVVVTSNAPVRITPLQPGGADLVLDGRAPGTLEVTPQRHCELTQCNVRIGSAAPFGLLWWQRELVLTLPRSVLVAPRLGPPDPVQLADLRRRDESERRVPMRLGEPRGVREYRPGDLRHWVHWPATAHAGTLMVRDSEGPLSRPVTVRADLPPDPDEGERAAERVLGTVGELLTAGRQVTLVTLQSDGEQTALVAGLLDAGRRLARALPARRP